MSSPLSNYAGWIFRLNLPTSSSTDALPATDGDDTNLEGVQLLSLNKSEESNGINDHIPSSSPTYLAELCPKGVSVTTLDQAATTPPQSSSQNWSWSFSSQSCPSKWNVTSSKLLSVTYRPAHEAYPSYTNISRSREYWNKSVGSCVTSCCDAACNCSACRGGTGGSPPSSPKRRGKWSSMKRTMSGAPKPIHRVKIDYTVDDILHIEPLSADNTGDDETDNGVWIRGIGNCHALRIYLRPKFGSSRDNGSQGIVDGSNAKPNNDIGFKLSAMEEWDNLQSPPWNSGDAMKVGDDQTEVKHWGPILTFAIPCQDDKSKEATATTDNCQPLLWKVHHPPNPNVALDSFLLMEGALNLHMQNLQGKSSSSFDYDVPTNVYVNGYQSWSYAGSVVQGEPQPGSAMPDVLSGAFSRGGVVLSGDSTTCDGDSWSDNFENATSSSPMSTDDVEELNATTAFYKSDMFACISSNGTTSQNDDGRILLDEEAGPALITGFLSQREQYGVVCMDKELRNFNLFACHEGQVATSNNISSDWAYLQILDSSCYDEEAMVYYIHACGDHNDARAMEKGLTYGWCSWYHYYENIDHDSLSKNAHVLHKAKSKIGFNLCLVDDGYMTSWGDWTSLKPGKFVNEGGMRVLADAIRSKGMQPGVWLAPFACDKNSKLAKDHPDWIIRNDSGRYANSANCGKFFYGLDATNPEVRKHVYDTIHRAVHEWGFDVLKLDFLYASCLAGNGKYDNTMSRAEAFYLGLRTIREAAGDETFIIGCGCPLGSAIGFVDGMRVSCDTGPTWLPEFPLPHWDNGTLPSLRGMLRNTLSRSVLGHRWWHNDPDCVLLGNTTKHTDHEVVSASSVVGMTGGMFLLSDDMEKVSDARLSIARKIFPLTGVTAVPLDLHSTMNCGMPSVLRLWCTEKSITVDDINANIDARSFEVNVTSRVLREQASKLQTEVGWSPRNNSIDPYSRERSCFFVAPGLGSWTVVSLSNWKPHSTTMSVSFAALVAHSIQDFAAMGAPKDSISCGLGEKSGNGYHVFSFWSSEYLWIPHETLVDNSPLVKKLESHQTEIFHIKRADPTSCQYIGSDLHFSCGFEVASFEAGRNRVLIELKNDYAKKGSVYLYLPDGKKFDNATVEVNGAAGRMKVIARPSLGGNDGVVVRVPVEIKGTKEGKDGVVSISC